MHTPTNYGYPAPPPRRSNRARNIALAVGAVVVAVVAAVVIVVVTKDRWMPSNAAGGSSTATASASGGYGQDADLLHDREGYSRALLLRSVGDPFALKLESSGEPQVLASGEQLIPACGVLTISDLTDVGLLLDANDFGYPVQQSYFDKKGLGLFGPDLNQFPSAEDTSSCYYGLDSSDGATAPPTAAPDPNDPNTDTAFRSAAVSVYPSFVVASGPVDNWISTLNFVPDTSISDTGGMTLYSKTGDGPNEMSYLLRSPDVTVILRLSFPEVSADGPKLIKAVLDNLDRLKDKPEGAYVPSYDSPTFTKTYARACDYIDNDDVNGLTGFDSSPLAREGIPTATGVLDLSEVDADSPPSGAIAPGVADAPTKSNYIRSSCTREGLDPARAVLSSPLYQDVRLTTTTYESPAAASAGLLYLSAGVDNTSKVKVDGVGEEAYVYLDFDQQAVLAFRQGRVVGELLFNFANQTGTADQMADTLSPLATKIAGLLASYT